MAPIAVGPCRRGRGREALKELEFYAHADLFVNPAAEMADIVLAVASAFEREGLEIGFEISAEAQSLVQLRPAMAPPPGEARPDTEIIFDLAVRLDLGEQFWNGRRRRRLPLSARPDWHYIGAAARQSQRRAADIAKPVTLNMPKWGVNPRRGALLPHRGKGNSIRRRSSSTATRHCRSSRSHRSAQWLGPIWQRTFR